MKRFLFELEPVLKIRTHEEELQKQAFARQMQQMIKLREQHDEIKAELDIYSAEHERHGALRSPLEYQRHFSFIQLRQQELAQLGREIDLAKEQTEKERKKLITANQKTRVLENLKEKKRIEYMKIADMEEQKVMNEIATQRFHRKSM